MLNADISEGRLEADDTHTLRSLDNVTCQDMTESLRHVIKKETLG